MMNSEVQVFVYFDDPDDQVIQTTYSTYLSYYRHIGWQLLGKAAELPLVPERAAHFRTDALAGQPRLW